MTEADYGWKPLRDIREGVFETKDGVLGFKAGYLSMNYKEDSIYQVDAYELLSGEYWQHGHETVRERDAELVRSVDVYALLGRKEPRT